MHVNQMLGKYLEGTMDNFLSKIELWWICNSVCNQLI
jgi:hypothetical protein